MLRQKKNTHTRIKIRSAPARRPQTLKGVNTGGWSTIILWLTTTIPFRNKTRASSTHGGVSHQGLSFVFRKKIKNRRKKRDRRPFRTKLAKLTNGTHPRTATVLLERRSIGGWSTISPCRNTIIGFRNRHRGFQHTRRRFPAPGDQFCSLSTRTRSPLCKLLRWTIVIRTPSHKKLYITQYFYSYGRP